MLCALLDLQRSSPPRTIDFEPEREFPPICKNGGAKTRRLTFAKARWLKDNSVLQEGRRVLGGHAPRAAEPLSPLSKAI